MKNRISEEWKQPAWSPASTIDTALCLSGRKTVLDRFEQQPRNPVPTNEEFVSEVLDSRIVIVDAGNGRTLFDGSILQLVVQKLRAEGDM